MSNTAEITVDDTEEFVTFTAGDQVFCIKITQIREIRRWAPVTALPHTPPDVLGVMNLRGAVIPIIDLSLRFGLGRTEPKERNVVIIVINGESSVGMLVQSVSEILSVSTDQIQDTGDVRSTAATNYITGIISTDDHMIRVIDLPMVLNGHMA